MSDECTLVGLATITRLSDGVELLDEGIAFSFRVEQPQDFLRPPSLTRIEPLITNVTARLFCGRVAWRFLSASFDPLGAMSYASIVIDDRLSSLRWTFPRFALTDVAYREGVCLADDSGITYRQLTKPLAGDRPIP